MAQTQVYNRRCQIGITEVATAGTHVVPTASDLFQAVIGDTPITFNTAQGENIAMRTDGMMNDVPPICSVNATISFGCPIRAGGGGGAADILAPDYEMCLFACGMAAVSAGTPVDSIDYIPTTTFDSASGYPHDKGYSITIIEDGKIGWGIRDAYGTFTLDLQAGQQGMINFTMTGAYVPPVDDDTLTPSPAYDTEVAPCFQGAALTVAGSSPVGVAGVTIDLGNTVTMIPDVNGAQGYSKAIISGRNTTGSLTAQVEHSGGAGTVTPWSLALAGTPFAFTTGTIGTLGTGNAYQVLVNRAARMGLPPIGSEEGIRTYQLDFAAKALAADVEITNPDFELKFVDA